MFTQKNDSDDGIFRVNRGTFDYRVFADIEAWGKSQETLSAYLTFWPGEKSYCNEIQGTDGLRYYILFFLEYFYCLNIYF